MQYPKSISVVLALTTLIAALLLSSCSPMQIQTEADDIQAIADSITSFSMPEGYTEELGVELAGYQLVGLTGATPSCHIYLLQAPKDADVDIDKLQKQLSEMEGSKSKDGRTLKVVEQRPATIRGQAVSLAVGEGINSENLPYREVTGLFQGKNGPALVSISSPVDLWDWTVVEEFLSSLE